MKNTIKNALEDTLLKFKGFLNESFSNPLFANDTDAVETLVEEMQEAMDERLAEFYAREPLEPDDGLDVMDEDEASKVFAKTTIEPFREDEDDKSEE